MALSDNPYIGLGLTALQAKQALWLQAQDDIARTGQSTTFPGMSLTSANLGQIRDTLSELKVAIDYTLGNTRSFVQVRINTRRNFSAQPNA